MKKDFYDKVSAILGVDHEYNTYNDKIWRHDRVTGQICGTNNGRFAGRHPGNGRYPGIGTVRHFGSAIHIALNSPKVQKICASEKEALDFLTELFT